MRETLRIILHGITNLLPWVRRRRNAEMQELYAQAERGIKQTVDRSFWLAHPHPLDSIGSMDEVEPWPYPPRNPPPRPPIEKE